MIANEEELSVVYESIKKIAKHESASFALYFLDKLSEKFKRKEVKLDLIYSLKDMIEELYERGVLKGEAITKEQKQSIIFVSNLALSYGSLYQKVDNAIIRIEKAKPLPKRYSDFLDSINKEK